MSDSGFIWIDDRFSLKNEELDKTHREFVLLANRCASSSKKDFPTHLKALLEHTQEHFGSEEERMETCGDPSIAEHKAEHARVLGELTQFLRRSERGNTIMAQAYVREKLPEWFALHTSTMDSALAAHIAKP